MDMKKDKCPKCGTPKPKPGDTFPNTEGGVDPCVRYVEGCSAALIEHSCWCDRLVGWFTPYKKYDAHCERCKGTGTYTLEREARPESLLYTCPGCSYRWKEPIESSNE